MQLVIIQIFSLENPSEHFQIYIFTIIFITLNCMKHFNRFYKVCWVEVATTSTLKSMTVPEDEFHSEIPLSKSSKRSAKRTWNYAVYFRNNAHFIIITVIAFGGRCVKCTRQIHNWYDFVNEKVFARQLLGW